MKKKPQIAWKQGTRQVWTLNNKPVEYEVARKHWDSCSADWTSPAYQAMAEIVMAEGRKPLEP